MSRSGRTSNQELRTRKDLLAAAARLLKEGRKPSMDEVAREALVSRATAYRCFRNVEVLLAEAPVDAAAPGPEDVFAECDSQDPEERIDLAEARLHETVFKNEPALRIMLANAVTRALEEPSRPIRQNRRGALIDAALAPVRDRFSDSGYTMLRSALAMILGTESMIVAKDVIRIDEATARKAKSWAVRALVRAALEAPADASAPKGNLSARRAKRARPPPPGR